MKLFEDQMDKINLGMVINNKPCYAYLMRCNHTVDQNPRGKRF
jgi:spore cortex formation protein SpoVR/YcgB (stage V sporulation)